MAIIEKQKPALYSTPHARLLHVVESDNTAEANFKFIFEVYIDSVKVATVKRWPVPGTIYGVFDASEIVRAYLTNLYFDGNPAALNEYTLTEVQGKFLRTFEVKYGEEYGEPLTSYLALATSGLQDVFNYAPDINEDDTTIVGFSDKFLTERPTTTTLPRGKNLFLPFWNPSEALMSFQIDTFNASGVFVSTQTITSTEYFILLGLGSEQLNATFPGFITDAVHSYTVTRASDVFRINLECDGLYTPYHMIFLNRYGGFESVIFRGKSKRTAEIERKHYGTSDYRLSTTPGDIGTKNFVEGSSNVYLGNGQMHDIRKKYRYQLTTDFLSDEEFAWLGQLASSPVVYLELNGKYYPAKITGNNYEYITHNYGNRLSPLEIDIEVMKNYNTQFA
jgi:hypothetical protein